MKIAVITSIKAPYRTLQMDEICKEESIDMTLYYTNCGKEDRDWEEKVSEKFNEVWLDNIKVFDKLGTLNKGLINIVKENEIIVLGGYDKPTYIMISLICKIMNKKYILLYDGISCNRLNQPEKRIKKYIKNIVVKNSSAIWGNGKVSREYFVKHFNYKISKIYNQILTVDGDRIQSIGKNKFDIKNELRDKYGIDKNQVVLQYSGRLVDVKNIESIIKAIAKLKMKNITLLITGGGTQDKYLKNLARELGVNIIITGFINNQDLLFKHYFMSDIFILASIYEPWGLVVNEAMFAGLPVLVSDICGCSLDLVEEGKNGYLINPHDINDMSDKISKMLNDDNLVQMGDMSLEIIQEWKFSNSCNSFKKMIEKI